MLPVRPLPLPLVRIFPVTEFSSALFSRGSMHCLAVLPKNSRVNRALRACLKIPRGAVFVPRAGWRGVTKENTLRRSSAEEQQSQTALGAPPRRRVFCLCPALARSAQPASGMHLSRRPMIGTTWPKPKSLAAAPLAIFRQALSLLPQLIQANSTCPSGRA